jgi:pyridoxine 4-dehydrogenase
VLSLKGTYNLRRQAPDYSPTGLRAVVDDALRVLDGTKSIDLFECARIDPLVPIETTVGALAKLIAEGKIGSYGLSEVSPATIRRAYAVYPPAAVEEELSLFSRYILEGRGVADIYRELGIPLVGYSPLGSRWLTGQFKRLDDLPADDYRRRFPRFGPGAFERNVELAEAVGAIAQKKACTSAQIAIAWYVLFCLNHFPPQRLVSND